MDPEMAASFAKIGAAACVSFAAIGSALGAGAAGSAAIGAWKRCYIQNKPASFMLLAFVGAPLTQTFYGMVLMNDITGKAAAAVEQAAVAPWPSMIVAGILGGIAMGFSAWFQGKAGAAASDSLGETEQGFVNNILVLGVIESVALFVMVFLMG